MRIYSAEQRKDSTQKDESKGTAEKKKIKKIPILGQGIQTK